MWHFFSSRIPLSLLTASVLALGGCGAWSGNPAEDSDSEFEFDDCSIPTGQLVSATAKDAIPALTNPPTVDAGSAADYLRDDDRVVGLFPESSPVAVPLNILWHHEIVNLSGPDGGTVAVTHCPLTGSSLVFDRSKADGSTFAVSGLLLNNNLVMYDRSEKESLWPQMSRMAKCGAQSGKSLDMIPVAEMTWKRWKTLHPGTRVTSSNTGYDFRYGAAGYPYGHYDEVDNDRLLYDMEIDARRPPKERVLGIPYGNDGGLAVPFGLLEGESPYRVVTVAVEGTQKTVFWDREARAAMAFLVDGSFSVTDGRIRDETTGSIWTVTGRAVQGPRRGERLEPVDDAYVAFWFAWAAFQPDTRIWSPSE